MNHFWNPKQRPSLSIALAMIWVTQTAWAGHSVSIATDEDVASFENKIVQNQRQKIEIAPRDGGVRSQKQFGAAVSDEARKLRTSSDRSNRFGQAVSSQRRQGGDDGTDSRMSNDSSSVRSNAQQAAQGKGNGKAIGRGKNK